MKSTKRFRKPDGNVITEGVQLTLITLFDIIKQYKFYIYIYINEALITNSNISQWLFLFTEKQCTECHDTGVNAQQRHRHKTHHCTC